MPKGKKKYWDEDHCMKLWKNENYTELHKHILEMSKQICGRYQHKYFYDNHTVMELANDAMLSLPKFKKKKGRMFTWLTTVMFTGLNNRRRQFHQKKNAPFEFKIPIESFVPNYDNNRKAFMEIKEKVFNTLFTSSLDSHSKSIISGNLAYISEKHCEGPVSNLTKYIYG